MATLSTAEVRTTTPKKPRFGFLFAMGVVLSLMVLGHGVGKLIAVYPPWLALRAGLVGDSQTVREMLAIDAMDWRAWMTTAFAIALIAYVVVWRDLIATFFRKMHVGVTLVSFTALSVLTGVLIPQIDGFEDPATRVPSIDDIDAKLMDAYLAAPKYKGDEFPEAHPNDNPILADLPTDQLRRAKDYRRQFDAFRWAETYFVYHLLHPYGIGMHADPIPAPALAGLDRYERIYGHEERRNRETMMEAAFASGPKTAEIEDLQDRWTPTLRRAFDLCTTLDLNRTYKSNWFATLLCLLATSVAFNTFRGKSVKWFSVEKIGFFTTHIGILTLLAGGLVSNLLTDRGILQLFLGDAPQDTYWDNYRSDKRRQMPFALKLDHFARKEWKALEIESLDPNQSFKSKPPRFTLWPGREIPLDFVQDATNKDKWTPQLLLRVVDLYDHARIDMPAVHEAAANEQQGTLPVVELEVPNNADDRARLEAAGLVVPEGPTRTMYLSPRMSSQSYFDPDGKFRLAASYDTDPRAMFPTAAIPTLGTLYIGVLTGKDLIPVAVPVRLGESMQLQGGYSVKIVDATSDFKPGMEREQQSTVTVPLEQQPLHYCAVWIDVTSPKGKVERRCVREQFDAMSYGEQDRYPLKEVVSQLQWDRWACYGPPRYVIEYGRQAEPRLISESGEATPITVGQALALPGATAVKPLRFLHKAVFEKKLQFQRSVINSDGWDESFYSPDARGLVLEVVHDPKSDHPTSERVDMASTDTWQADTWVSGDTRFAVHFLENTEGFPFDWRSVLSVVERDQDGREYTVPLGSEKGREIRVNDYFKYKGYRFFQTNADPEDPNYSGIGVVYDPGIPIVLLGMYTIILGTVLAFIVRPIVRARRERSVAA
jgi:hypothetical protein